MQAVFCKMIENKMKKIKWRRSLISENTSRGFRVSDIRPYEDPLFLWLNLSFEITESNLLWGFRFKNKFKTEFLGPFTGARNPLKKVLHILSICPPNFIFRNKIICLKTKIFSGIRKQHPKQKRKKKSTLEENYFHIPQPSTAKAKRKINLS